MRLLTTVLSRIKIAKFISSEEGQVAFENAQRDIITLYPDIAYLESDEPNSTSTLVDSSLKVEIKAGKVYMLDAVITYQSSNINNGMSLALKLPSGASVSGGFWTNNSVYGTESIYNNASSAFSDHTKSVGQANANMSAIGHWIVKADTQTSGNVTLQFRSEGTDTITLKGGLCVLRLMQVV
jgi:hypothetical protein